MNDAIAQWEKEGWKSLTTFPIVNVIGYDLYMLSNVSEIILYLPQYCHVKLNQPIDAVAPQQGNSPSNVGQNNYDMYFIIDTPNHNSFGHFFFESSIYIHLYKELKKVFVDLKILTVSQCNYKNIILKYFGVDDTEIATTFGTNNNICYVPVYHQCSLNSNSHMNLFDRSLSIIYPIYNNYKSLNIQKNIDVMIMPRHRVENNPHTDRTIDTSDIETKLNSMQNCCVYETSTNTLFERQITKIKQTKILIVPDGSSLLVNGFFAKNSVIVVLGYGTINQANIDTPKIKLIHKYIAQNNVVIFIVNLKTLDRKNSIYTYDMIQHLMDINAIQFPVINSEDRTKHNIILPESITKSMIKFEENMYLDNTLGIADRMMSQQ